MKLSSYKYSNSSNLSIHGFCKFKKFWRFNDNYDWPGKAKIIGFTLLLLLVSMPTYANDFYPFNCKPVNNDHYDSGTPIPIEFDICLGYNYPASASEWYVEVIIKDESNSAVLHAIVDGFDANGPACYPFVLDDFMPISDGTYTITIEVFYTQEINHENDMYMATFKVGYYRDLELVEILNPQPGSEFFDGFPVGFELLVKNNGEVVASAAEWHVDDFFGNPIKGVDIDPGTQMIVKKNQSYPYRWTVNGQFGTFFGINYSGDQNNSNDTGSVVFTILPKPLWPNEIKTHNSGLLKSNNNLAGEEFIEILTNQSIADPSTYKITIFDSTGQKIDSVGLDQFSAGQTVDSFVVKTFTFAGDVLPDTYGGFALSYNGFPILDFFLSWGGTITAVDGDWTDSTSTDIGILPQPGNSIALTGNGTDFEQYSWELTPTPSPGAFNPNQQIPVELKSFTASVDQNGVILSWSTATEKNNSGFQVERSVETGNKSFNFENIGFVKGAGTTTESKDYSFIDGTARGERFQYRLKQIDYDGSFSYSDIIEVNLVDALNFNLSQNYPNPFNPSTTISFSIPASDFITLKVFDVLGNEIKTLINDYKSAGRYEIDFDAKNLASGIYFYKIQSSKFVEIKKMVLAR